MAEVAQKSLLESHEDIIAKHQIKLESRLMHEILPTHKFIIIRHGFSEHNLIEKEMLYKNPLKGKNDPRYQDLHMNPIFVDSPLHAIGIQQCVNSQQSINEIEFDTVFISPLQRAIQTCIYMFATHPNRQNIKFVLLPELYECLCSSGCFGPNTLTTLKLNVNLLAKQHNITLDFSRVEELGRYWQIRILEDQTLAKAILDQIEASDKHDEHAYQTIVFNLMTKSSSYFLETWKMLFMRTRKAIQILQKHTNTASEDPNKKIGIVSHGFLIKCLTASKIEDNGRVEEGQNMENCAKLPFNF